MVLVIGGAGAIFLVSQNSMVAECPTLAAVEKDLNANVADGEGLIFFNGALPTYMSDALALQASHSKKLLHRPIALIRGRMSPDLLAQFPQRVWLVTGNFPQPVEQLVPGATVLKRINSDIKLSLFYLDLSDPSTAATRPSGPGT